MAYRLTTEGKERVARYLNECEAFRKEILDGGKDTADDTNIPTEAEILEDIEYWDDEDGIYNDCWGVTDNYSLPIELIFGRDYICA